MRHWLRVTIPPASIIAGFAATYVFVEVCMALAASLFALRLPLAVPPGAIIGQYLKEGTPLGRVILCFSAAAYGVFRGGTFHPTFRPGYRQWLELTPWSSRDQLPLGPIHLVWQDAVIPVALCLLALRHDEIHFLAPALIASGMYLAVLAISFWGTGVWAFAYAAFFLLGLMLRLERQPWAAAAIAAVTYLVSLWGLRDCLARFPWADRPRGEDAFDQRKQQDRDVGWPLKQLCPTSSSVRVPAVHGFLISVLVGWWLYAGASLNSDLRDRSEFLGVVYLIVGSAAIIGRCVIYMWGYLPPISLWGRVRSMRWVIPGYDQIFVAPLCIVAVWTVANRVGKLTDPLFVVPVAVTLFLVLAFNMGPTLKTWHTTGRHRMAPFLIKAQYQKI